MFANSAIFLSGIQGGDNHVLGQRQKNAENDENTTDLPKTLQMPSLYCFS